MQQFFCFLFLTMFQTLKTAKELIQNISILFANKYYSTTILCYLYARLIFFFCGIKICNIETRSLDIFDLEWIIQKWFNNKSIATLDWNSIKMVDQINSIKKDMEALGNKESTFRNGDSPRTGETLAESIDIRTFLSSNDNWA